MIISSTVDLSQVYIFNAVVEEMVVDLSADISLSIQDRIVKMGELLNTTSEEAFNSQPLPTKRNPAEIMTHIILIDWIPLWFVRLYNGVLNMFNHQYDNLESKNIYKTADSWNLESGNPRKAKYITKTKLVKRFTKLRKKLEKNAGKTKSGQLALKTKERHMWWHLSQIDLLLEMLTV